MEITSIVNPVLQQLATLLSSLTVTEYTTKSALLGNSSIGAHVRHTIEMYQCMLNGYESGLINYEKRERNIVIECDQELAAKVLFGLCNSLPLQNKTLTLEGEYCSDDVALMGIPTNYYRELIYNLEHTIHHMALIRVGVQTLTDINLPKDFGVAPSTLKHQQACAQ